MLYFTQAERAQGAIAALYNGRFAFVSGLRPQDALSVPQLLALAEGGGRSSLPGLSEPIMRALVEEHQHLAWWGKCQSALYLNGFRLLARVAWLVSRRESLPGVYYRQRTQFFRAMYQLHEDAVAASAQNGASTGGMSADEIAFKIEREDARLCDAWRAGMSPLWRLAFSVSCAVGARLSKHFAVVSVDTAAPGRTATSVALSGVWNTSGSFGARRGRWLERLLVHLRPEAILRMGSEGAWRWMTIKFREEREELERLLGAAAAEEYRRYVQRVIAFLSCYFEVRDQLGTFRLEKFLLRSDWGQLRSSSPPAWALGEEIAAVVGFFYGHGN